MDNTESSISKEEEDVNTDNNEQKGFVISDYCKSCMFNCCKCDKLYCPNYIRSSSY